MKCERGGCMGRTSGYDLFDYCNTCSKNLCGFHMAEGCCGVVPAESGDRVENSIVIDLSEETPEARKAALKTLHEQFVEHPMPVKRPSRF